MVWVKDLGYSVRVKVNDLGLGWGFYVRVFELRFKNGG